MEKTTLSIEDLIKRNPKANRALLSAVTAQMEELRKLGFAPEGYRLTAHRNLLVGKETPKIQNETLPRRRR
jgi:hypothetical protein